VVSEAGVATMSKELRSLLATEVSKASSRFPVLSIGTSVP
jgi:hypothetical protein